MGSATPQKREERHTVVLPVRITPTLKRALEREAERDERTEAQVIRRALAAYLLQQSTDQAMKGAA